MNYQPREAWQTVWEREPLEDPRQDVECSCRETLRRKSGRRGPSSVHARDKSRRARAVGLIRVTKCWPKQGLLGARPQITANRHENKAGPYDGGGNPNGAAKRKQVQAHVDRMPQDPERPSGGKLMPSIKLRAVTPRGEMQERPNHLAHALAPISRIINSSSDPTSHSAYDFSSAGAKPSRSSRCNDRVLARLNTAQARPTP